MTGEEVLVSPHRTKRPWQGKLEEQPAEKQLSYDPGCNLCPGNKRSDGTVNPDYTDRFVFTNDFSALLPHTKAGSMNMENLIVANTESGICRVVCFSPNHSLTLPLMEETEIVSVIELWQQEFSHLAATSGIRYIQIFENKGAIMGCSNPHPHGQIWATSSLPLELTKETNEQFKYYQQNNQSLLADYLALELTLKERIVLENDDFVTLVPFWAVWPYETMIVSKRHIQNIMQFTDSEKNALAAMVKELTIRYDNLFHCSFPYSAGMHQAPVNDGEHPEWHWHWHFFPPLLRSATVKKFMVGFEMLAGPQRDISAEAAATILKNTSSTHYKAGQKNGTAKSFYQTAKK